MLDIHISAGGLFVSAVLEKYLHDYEQIDSVICGEGEVTILDLAERIFTGNVFKGM